MFFTTNEHARQYRRFHNLSESQSEQRQSINRKCENKLDEHCLCWKYINQFVELVFLLPFGTAFQKNIISTLNTKIAYSFEIQRN